MAPVDDASDDKEPFFERFSTERIVRLVTEKEDIHDFRPVLRPPVPVLTVLDDGSLEHGEEFRLRRDRLAIGRTSGEVQIPNDSSISRAHAEIRRLAVQGGGYRWQLHDLGSVNGTFVRCLRAPLHPQTIVILGGRRYQLKNPLNVAPVLAGDSTDTSLVDGRHLPDTSWPLFVEKTAKPGAGEHLLEADKYLLGRMGGGADIEIDDPLLANKHAILRRQRDGSWMIQA
ncbi:MAG: FHA domain-containing protein, partial [Planctomycetia bacterium]